MDKTLNVLCKITNEQLVTNFINQLIKQDYKDFLCYLCYEIDLELDVNDARFRFIKQTSKNPYIDLFSNTSGDYVLFTDTNTVYESDFLVRMMDEIVNQQAQIVVGDMNLSLPKLLNSPLLQNKIFRKEIIKPEFFLDNNTLHDLALTPILLLQSDRISYVNEIEVNIYKEKVVPSVDELITIWNHLLYHFHDDYYYELEYLFVKYVKQFKNNHIKKLIRQEFPYYHVNMYRKKIPMKKWLYRFNMKRDDYYD